MLSIFGRQCDLERYSPGCSSDLLVGQPWSLGGHQDPGIVSFQAGLTTAAFAEMEPESSLSLLFPLVPFLLHTPSAKLIIDASIIFHGSIRTSSQILPGFSR